MTGEQTSRISGHHYRGDRFSCSVPAPATSSRHLYTGHHQGHTQAAPRLRARPEWHAFVPDPPTRSGFDAVVFSFDASAVVHTRSSSRRTPAPLSAGLLPQRSPPRLLTDAACGGLGSPPARRTRRALLHHWYSTLHAGDLLHRHHSTSGHTWVPTTVSRSLISAFIAGRPHCHRPEPAQHDRPLWPSDWPTSCWLAC